MVTKVKKRITLLLKRRPGLYRFVASIYWLLNPYHLVELLVGTQAREWQWNKRHLVKGNDWNSTQHLGEDQEWVMGYWDSQNHSHRAFVLEKVSSFYPFNSVLEIGCNCGPNLYLIAQKFPNVEIRGIDINSRAVQMGNELFTSQGISNVRLAVGKADGLGQFKDKSFDVIFTDAVLIYIGRDKIMEVIQEMVRVARRVLIFVEWHSFKPLSKDPNGLGVYYHGCWKRDYISLLRRFVPEERIKITKITDDIWPDANWKEVGYIVEVIL